MTHATVNRRQGLVLAAIVLGVLGFSLLVGAQTTQVAAQDTDEPVVEAARQVTPDASPVRLFNIPDIAVHPDEPNTAVVLVGDARNGGCGLHVTRDGGLSWSVAADTVMPDELEHCIQRSFGPTTGVEFASDGTLYAALSGSTADNGHPNGPVAALLARSRDLGQSHETFMVRDHEDLVIEHEGEEYELFEQNRMSTLAVDPTDPDVVYRGWHRRVSGVSSDEVPFGERPQRAFVAVSTDGGETWTDPIDVMQNYDGDPEEVFGSSYIDLVTGPDGTAYGFVRGSPADRDDPQPFYMVKSTDQGETWTTEVIHDGAANINRPSAAVDPESGQLYLAWDERGDSNENPSNIYFMTSTDQGETWDEPIQLNDDDPGRGANQYFPGVSVAPDGRVDVAWHDFRNDPFFTQGEAGGMGSADNERWWDVYHTHSTDGGDTWAANTRVTDRSIDANLGSTYNNQDHRGPIGIASTERSAYVVWPDSRAGGGEFDAEDAYFTRLRFDSAEPTAATGTSAGTDVGWMWAALGAGVALVVGGVVLLVGVRIGRSRAAS